jgi:protein TonB
MKKFVLLFVLSIFIDNTFSQIAPKQITLKKGGVIDKNKTPYIDDSSLFPDKHGIYKECEYEPTFPGGNKAFLKFMTKNTKWPDKSGTIDVQGKVLVAFVVEKNGELTHFKITKSLDPIFDKEALRVIKLSPKWIPGRISHKKVRCWYTVPFNFALNN